MTPSPSDLALYQVVRDDATYIESLLYVQDLVSRKIVPFRLTPQQRKVLQIRKRILDEGRLPRIIVLKHRRPGMSTLGQAIGFKKVTTEDNRRAVTLAHDKESTREIFGIAQLFYRELDGDFRPHRLTQSNMRDLNFDQLNSRYFIGTAGSFAFGSGSTLDYFHGSEVSKWPGGLSEQEQLLASFSIAAEHGEIFLESTPKGMAGLFYQMWQDAKEPTNDYEPIFFPWWEDLRNTRALPDGATPEDFIASYSDEERDLVRRAGLSPLQISWRRWRSVQPDVRRGLFAQEFPEDDLTCFLTSSSSFFDGTILRGLIRSAPKPVEIRRDGELEIWEKPQGGASYVVGADVGAGLPHSDWSVAAVLNRRTLKQAARLRCRVRPDEFGLLAARLADEYQGATLAVESNNHGHSTLNTLENSVGYGELYRHVDYDPIKKQTRRELGWPTNTRTRQPMLDKLRAALEDGAMEACDRTFLGECLTFEDNGSGKYEAREGCWDDTVMAWGIALEVRERTTESVATIPAGWSRGDMLRRMAGKGGR